MTDGRESPSYAGHCLSPGSNGDGTHSCCQNHEFHSHFRGERERETKRDSLSSSVLPLCLGFFWYSLLATTQTDRNRSGIPRSTTFNSVGSLLGDAKRSTNTDMVPKIGLKSCNQIVWLRYSTHSTLQWQSQFH